MTLTELGALGELIGAIAVVVTLVYLSIQVRHSRELLEAQRRTMEENARLNRAAAMNRHADAVSRWRGRLINDAQVAELWLRALSSEEISGVERVRMQNLFVDWVNTYRSAFSYAKSIGAHALSRQAVLSVSQELEQSRLLREFWDWGRSYNELAAADFVADVEEAVSTDLRLTEPTATTGKGQA